MQAQACHAEAAQQIAAEDAADADVITASAQGEDCASASVTLRIRNAAGDELWRHDSTYHAMTSGGSPPAQLRPVTLEEMQAFLAGWANVTTMRASALPPWTQQADQPGAPGALALSTPLARDAYQALRGNDAAVICLAMDVTRSECMTYDAQTRAAAPVLASGA